jgi:hypothetical protein
MVTGVPDADEPDDADELAELLLHAARTPAGSTASALSAAAFLETRGNTDFMPTASKYRATLVFFCQRRACRAYRRTSLI